MVDDFRGRGGSPWGSPPGGGSGNGSGSRGPTPPNIDELIKNLPDKINKFLPGGASGGGKPIIFGLTSSMNFFVTDRATSDSNRACLIFLKPSSACFSSSLVILLKNLKANSILSVKFSNIFPFFTPSSYRTSGRNLAD